MNLDTSVSLGTLLAVLKEYNDDQRAIKEAIQGLREDIQALKKDDRLDSPQGLSFTPEFWGRLNGSDRTAK